MKYRRRPLEIEAVEWTGDNLNDIQSVISPDARVYNGCLFIGDILPNRGEVVIKDKNGVISTLKKETFNLLYEEVK